MCSITEINENRLENETLTSSMLRYMLQKLKSLAYCFRKINVEIYKVLKDTLVSLNLRK